ncbi:MAG TPA: FAD-dependent oxidoreductase [Cyclobacteriaceae bacterium]|nr:FAD-dependent oxidoreductase [Cyclobacteriaceae bacterium]
MSHLKTNTFSPSPTKIKNQKIGLPKGSSIAIVGAGAFGGWSALYLLRAGYKVTLVDAWGAGNSRSSSGDETRVIRSTYGNNEFYFDLNVRALTLWKENQTQWKKQLFFNTGVIWFCYDEKCPLVDDSIPFAKKHQMEYEYLSLDALQKKYPMVHTNNLTHAWFDPYGGYLKARESAQAVLEAFVKEGGNFVQAYATPGEIKASQLDSIKLSDGSTIKSDAYLFACGPWLGQLFPEVLGNIITCTKQEVFYFGVPKEQARQFDQMPAWIDVDGKDFYYGIPSNANRGFKIGVDLRGEKFDPTTGERISNPQVLADARKFIEMRFPWLKGAPVVENRVCPYENSPDGNFIFEGHPDASNLWFLGGGSGHGFKHGPALGELVAKGFVGV